MNPVVTLDAEQVKAIRVALLIGLSSLGEIDRLADSYGALTEVDKIALPETLRPVHPTGAPDTASDFADALRYLEV